MNFHHAATKFAYSFRIEKTRMLQNRVEISQFIQSNLPSQS